MKFRNFWAKSWLTLSIGALGSQTILFFFVIIISHLYDPFDFGNFSYLVGIASLLTPIATLRFETAIASAESNFEVHYFFKRAIFTTLIAVCIIFSILELGLKHSFLERHLTSNDAIYCLPFLVFLYSLYSIFSQLMVRERQFNKISFRGILQNLFTGTFQYSLGLIKPNFFSLLIGEVIGKLVGLFLLFPTLISNLRNTIKNLEKSTSNEKLRPRSPVRFMLPATLVDTASTSIFAVLIFHIFGSSASGNVAMAQRIISVPVVILGSTLGQVILGEFTHSIRVNSGHLLDKTKKLYWVLFLLGLFVSSITFAGGPLFIDLIFGDNWLEVRELVRLFALSLGVNLMWNPISSLFLAYRLWRLFLLISIFRIFMISSFAYIGIVQAVSYQILVLFMSLGGAIAQILGMLLLYSKIQSLSPVD